MGLAVRGPFSVHSLVQMLWVGAGLLGLRYSIPLIGVWLETLKQAHS